MALDLGVRSLETAMRDRFYTLKANTTIRNIEPEQPRLGPTLFPTRSVPTLSYKYWIEEQARYAMATFMSFDAESRMGYLPGQEAEWVSLAKIGIKFPIKESDIIEFHDAGRSLREEMLDKLERQMYTMAVGCRERQEALALEALTTGRIHIKENGVDQLVDFKVPAEQHTFVGGTSAWSDTENSNPVLDIQTWVMKMNELGRRAPAHIVTTKKVLFSVMMNKTVRLSILGYDHSPQFISKEQLNGLLTSLGLPTFITYDRQSYTLTSKGALSQFRPLREGLAILIPAGPLGEMLEGPTVEELMGGIPGLEVRNRAGLVYTLWGSDDPPIIWHKTVLTCFPTYTQSQNVFIADVARETA